MKNYIYISKSKVEMLFGQTPKKAQEKISAELGFNLGLLSGKIGSQVSALEQQSARLALVVRALKMENQVGGIDEDCPWVAGTLKCQEIPLPANPHIMLLAGTTATSQVLLAGSAANLVSGVPSATALFGYSYLPRIANALQEAVKEFEGQTPRGLILVERAIEGYEDELGAVAHAASKGSEGPTMEIEFVGKRLYKDASQHSEGVIQIITPLYVADVT